MNGDNPVFGEHDQQTLEQYQDVLMRAERGALMADGHLGYVMPIGGGHGVPKQGISGRCRF